MLVCSTVPDTRQHSNLAKNAEVADVTSARASSCCQHLFISRYSNEEGQNSHVHGVSSYSRRRADGSDGEVVL